MDDDCVLQRANHEGDHVKIRPIEVHDIEAVVELMHECHAESSFSNIPFVRELVVNVVRDHAESRNSHHEIFVAERTDGLIVGFMKCFMNDYWYNYQCSAMHEIWHVSKEHRGSTAAFKLFRAFGIWGVENKAIVLDSSVLIPDQASVDVYDQVMSKLGFVKAGNFYRKDVPGVRK